MRDLIFTIILFFLAPACFAGQWVVLNTSDIGNIQVIQAGNSTSAPEGLYISLKNDITGEASTYCSRRNFLVITDPKLVDKVYAGLLFGIATQKTLQFWADGANKCVMNIPLVTMFIMYP